MFRKRVILKFTNMKLEGVNNSLTRVEENCKYYDAMMAYEHKIDAWAKENRITLTKVSGIMVQRINIDGELETLLSKTANKFWTHQWHGGKRDEGEGPVATMYRELKEEAGLATAQKFASAIEDGSAYYYSSHVQMLGNGKALLIHGFGMNLAEGEELAIENGDDSAGYLWAGKKNLEGENGKRISLTEQGERVLEQILGFDRSRETLGELDNLREGAKDFRHNDWRYYGDPTVDLDNPKVFDLQREDLFNGDQKFAM